jgi:hypothetical protein
MNMVLSGQAINAEKQDVSKKRQEHSNQIGCMDK